MALRDTIAEAVNTVSQEPVEKTVETPVAAPQAETPVAEAAPEVGRTAGRPRDEKGRLLPGKPDPVARRPITPHPTEAAAPVRKPPSSWKKDYWDHWNKFDPAVQDYIEQREGEFAKGVSTYKTDFERVKPLADAIEPLLPVLKQYNIAPAQWIQTMGNAHHSLVFGTPQQKLQMFAKLAQDYQVPLQALYDPNAQQHFLMQQTLQPQTQQVDVKEVVQQQFAEMSAQQELKQFTEAKDASGNPLYPHYEKLRDDMALFLESGKAQTLQDAYEKAKRLHDDIWQGEQQAKQAAAQKAQQEAQQRQVAKAKATGVSPKTATPSEQGAAPTKGIRSAVEAAVAAHGGGGRV